MVFVEFTETGGRKWYFVGNSVEDIVAGALNVVSSDPQELESRREVTEGEVRKLELGCFDGGVESVTRGESASFLLGSVVA